MVELQGVTSFRSDATLQMSVFLFRALAKHRNRVTGSIEFDASYQVMLPGTGGQTRTCAKDPNVAKLDENRRVYWLPGSAAESTHEAPLNMKFRVARLVVEAATDSETEFDATQLEESEETRRLKHKTIPRHVNTDEHDTRQIAHLQSRIRSGETLDPAHRPQAGRHEGEDRRGGNDHLFSSRSTARESSLEQFGVGKQHFQPCRKPDWWVRVKHSDQLTGLG